MKWPFHCPLRPLLLLLSLLLSLRSTCSIPIDNSLVGSQIIKTCLENRKVDLAFILDGSGSIGDDTFELQTNFVSMLLDNLDIGPNATQAAVVQFSDSPQLEFGLGAYSNRLQLKGAVHRVEYLSGTTLTGAALTFTLEQVFRKNARGREVPKVAIILTDGQSQDSVVAPSDQLAAENVLVYAIGITNLINVNELRTIARSQRRVFAVDTFEQLDRSLSALIIQEMCKTDFMPGHPEIVCESDRIGVRARTKKPFEGYVFIKGHFHQDQCQRGSEHFLRSPSSIGISVALTDCGVKRYRSLNPRGVFVETVVVFMFHHSFMTKVDQAIRVQCFYMEAQKTVDVPLEVSMLTTELATEIYPMPICSYSLRAETPDGPEVDFAYIGEKVFHRWECEEHTPNYDVFGMLVHNCWVDDGLGDIVDLVNEKGCGTDQYLLGTPEYSSTLRVAVKESHIFKYADRPILDFQCQITVCYKQDGGCGSITCALRGAYSTSDIATFISAGSGGNFDPPDCTQPGSSRFKRSIGGQTLDVITKSIPVLDVKPLSFADIRNSVQQPIGSSSQRQTCISQPILILIIAALVFAYFLLALSLGAHLARRKGNYQM